MAFNFQKIARTETTLSELMVDRTKVNTDDIIKKYPDGVTINRFDIVNMFDVKKGEDVAFPVFTIKEDDSVCFFGGHIFTKIVHAWIAEYEGDIEAASNDLFKSGGVKVKLKAEKTRGGNNITTITVVD